jgi:hypothetical protein
MLAFSNPAEKNVMSVRLFLKDSGTLVGNEAGAAPAEEKRIIHVDASQRKEEAL